ncbi:MAG: large conductance mechanosensitive channel protein MscL [Bacteroidetes bacterium]|nr:large conductance mechanosensitive channel protein MscL [Bacteroidota bacterium]
MLKEFKEFAMKGNMLDMAVGIIIGAAFGTVVKSVVDDILMPIVSSIFKMPDFSNLYTVLSNPNNASFTSVAEAREAGAAVLAYGQFINALIAFLIVAFVLFMIVKAMNAAKRKEEAAAPAPPPGPTVEELLIQIRDNLARS